MEQTLVYRDVRYIVGPEMAGQRIWTIDPDGAPESGVAGNSGPRGSFKSAVLAAREAIDARLDGRTPVSPSAA